MKCFVPYCVVCSGKPREAIDMYLHNQDWTAAMRVAERCEQGAVDDIYLAQVGRLGPAHPTAQHVAGKVLLTKLHTLCFLPRHQPGVPCVLHDTAGCSSSQCPAVASSGGLLLESQATRRSTGNVQGGRRVAGSPQAGRGLPASQCAGPS